MACGRNLYREISTEYPVPSRTWSTNETLPSFSFNRTCEGEEQASATKRLVLMFTCLRRAGNQAEPAERTARVLILSRHSSGMCRTKFGAATSRLIPAGPMSCLEYSMEEIGPR